jgi:F-type H+-transporting ATPase subunit delta
MTPQAVARRYAHALFDVATRAGKVDAIGADLAAFQALVAGNADLGKVFASPGIPLKNKRAIVDELVARTGGVSGEVTRLLQMLADRDRLAMLDGVAAEYNAQAMRAARRVAAEVVSAVPLDAARVSALADALGRATGLQVTLTQRVDPKMVGGVVAKVGSLVFDGSVTRQLARMRDRLLAGA